MMQYLRFLKAKIITITLLSMILLGCGFHLRGWGEPIPSYLKNVMVQMKNQDSQLQQNLVNTFRSRGAHVVNQSDRAQIKVIIDHVDRSRTLTTVTSSDSKQYALVYQVTYHVTDASGTTLITSRQQQAQSTLYTNTSHQLNANAQMNSIYQSLAESLANQIVNQIVIKLNQSSDPVSNQTSA